MKSKIKTTFEAEITFLKNEEFCSNAVNKINHLLKEGYKLKEAMHDSRAISSTLTFVKNTIED